MTTTRVDEALLRRLAEAVGQGYVRTDDEGVEPYSHDETQHLSARPEAVVRPGSTEEIAAVLRIASGAGVSVTPRAAGTGKHGAAVPVHGGIVLSVDRLDRILEIDVENAFAVVEPCVITEVLQDAAAEHGLFYPPDPASKGSCHVGGNIQTNAGGMRAVKYGVTRDYVYGLTLVLPSGDVVECGGKLAKDSSGYQLERIVTGSEGTLAVVTRAILRLLPLPTHRGLMLAPFPTLAGAAAGVNAVLRGGTTPSALEIMERRAVEFSLRLADGPFPVGEGEACLLVEVDGFDAALVEAGLEAIGGLLLEHGAEDVLVATERKKMEELWQVRRKISEGLKAYTTYRGVDSIVPRTEIVPFLERTREIGARHQVEIVSFGHAGDGNLHVNVIRTDAQPTEEEWLAALDAAHGDLIRLAVDFGGSISGEHGIGLTERPWFGVRHSPEAIALMRRIKAAFDPKGILNPGKVLP